MSRRQNDSVVGQRLVALCVALVAFPSISAASERVECTVRSMHGAAAAGQIDPRLALLKRQLAKPPFTAFKTIRLVEAKTLIVAKGVAGQVVLPTKKIAKLTLKEMRPSAKGGARLRMHLSITRPNAQPGTPGYLPGTTFTIANGGTLLVAGDRYQAGTLIVGITCKIK